MRDRVRSLYIRGIALCHLVALASYAAQADVLIGPSGIAPISASLDGVYALIAVGMATALALVLGAPAQGPALLVLWAIYLALVTISGRFLGFQWDGLLVEATFCALFVARWFVDRTPPKWAWAAQHWLLFRLVFCAGWVKLSSGDPHWADGTALDYHFWTQPMPNPLSRWAHGWPGWVHQAGVAATFAVELGAPLLIPFGRVPRAVAAVAIAAFMGMLALTGNFGFFQILTIVLCVPLLDDRWLPGDPSTEPPSVARAWLAPFAAAQAAIGLLWALGWRNLPEPAVELLRVTQPLHSANPYGLFAVMTTDRVEIVLEGVWQDDPGRWRELEIRYKPGAVDRVPPQSAPHLPRVAWVLWFEALRPCRGLPEEDVLYPLMSRVVEGPGPIDQVFVPGTFDDGHPVALRARAYRYTFAPPGSGRVWDREPLGVFCPGVVER